MATRTTQTAEQTLAAEFKDLTHRRMHYSDIDDGETITPLGDRDAAGGNGALGGIVYAAFEPDGNDDDINVVVLDTDTLGFNAGTGSAHSGYVHIWSRS